MKTSEILNNFETMRDFQQLDTKELKKIARTLADTANKRIKRLDKAGLNSPAKQKLNSSGVSKFTTANKGRKQLLDTIYQERQFLESKTSSLGGARTAKTRMAQSMGGDLTDEQANKLWKTYNRVIEQNPDILLGQYLDSNQTIEAIRNMVVDGQDMTIDEMVESVDEMITQRYEDWIELDDEEWYEID